MPFYERNCKLHGSGHSCREGWRIGVVIQCTSVMCCRDGDLRGPVCGCARLSEMRRPQDWASATRPQSRCCPLLPSSDECPELAQPLAR